METSERITEKCGASPTKNWVDRDFLIGRGFTDKFLRKFVKKFGKTSTRKLGKAMQSRRLYCLEDVNKAVTDGLINIDED